MFGVSTFSGSYLVHHSLALDTSLSLKGIGNHSNADMATVTVRVRHAHAICFQNLLNFSLADSTAITVSACGYMCWTA